MSGSATEDRAAWLALDIAALRRRADLGRTVSFKTDFYALPQVAQDALWGIAGELEQIADRLEREA